MELIIAILCFLGLMSYNEAGVTQEQVDAALRSNNVDINVTLERHREKHDKFDRSEEN